MFRQWRATIMWDKTTKLYSWLHYYKTKSFGFITSPPPTHTHRRNRLKRHQFMRHLAVRYSVVSRIPYSLTIILYSSVTRTLVYNYAIYSVFVIYVYIYIHLFLCVCVCVCVWMLWEWLEYQLAECMSELILSFIWVVWISTLQNLS